MTAPEFPLIDLLSGVCCCGLETQQHLGMAPGSLTGPCMVPVGHTDTTKGPKGSNSCVD